MIDATAYWVVSQYEIFNVLKFPQILLTTYDSVLYII